MPNFRGSSANSPMPPCKGIQAARGINRARQDDALQRYVGRRELRTLFPVSDMTIWRWMHDPEVAFPAPVKLGRNGRNFWWLPKILEWDRRRPTNSQTHRIHNFELDVQTPPEGNQP